MTIPNDRPLVCPLLIGRIDQLAALQQLIDAAGQGRGTVTCLAGEAGIGKSRLVAEATVYALAHGCSVLRGTCFPHAAASPYMLVLDLMRTHIVRPAPLEQGGIDDPLTRELAQLLPGMLPLVPGLAAPHRSSLRRANGACSWSSPTISCARPPASRSCWSARTYTGAMRPAWTSCTT